MHYRHGDIPFHPFEGKAEGKVVKHDGSFTVALGEATGHHHLLTVENPDDLTIMATPMGYILTLKSEGTLTHQEHGTLTIAPGIYRTGREREYDWFAKSTRRVID